MPFEPFPILNQMYFPQKQGENLMKTLSVLRQVNKKQWYRLFITTITIILLSFYVVFSFNNEEFSLPANPLSNDLSDDSFMPLQGDYASLLDEEKEEDQDDSEKDDELNDKEQDNEEITEQAENETQGMGDVVTETDENSPHLELIDDKGDSSSNIDNEYFSTTIVDGETVTDPNYKFRIIQKDHDYTVENIEVRLNNTPVENFQGQVTLEENENKITILVTYKDEKSKTFTVSRTYTVYLNTLDIIIYTDLENEQKIEEAELTFVAKAMYRGEEVALEATLNDETLKQIKENTYKGTLQEGKNIVRLTATNEKTSIEEELIVYYEPKSETITFDTNLMNETVTKENYSFYASAKAGNETIPLTVSHNDKTVEDDASGNYTVSLREGKNTITLKAKKGKNIAEKTYIVHLSKPDGGSSEDVEADFYIQFPDIKDGETIRNSVHTFHVKAVDEKGALRTNRGISITATNNGERIPIDWSNDAHVSFKLSVVDGTNEIKVTAKDRDGLTATATITIYGDIAGENEVIGSITFSLEATTIGLGYIIPPQKVDIYPQERASQVLDRIFEEHGISYEYTGSHENSFYLSAIYKPGLVTNPKIPEDLAELVARDFSRFDPEDYLPDSLGEFDFSNGSGWMYSVNGHYPNVGFADYYFKDGDVVRIRFTLALGADIGGGMPGTNYGKEW